MKFVYKTTVVHTIRELDFCFPRVVGAVEIKMLSSKYSLCSFVCHSCVVMVQYMESCTRQCYQSIYSYDAVKYVM